jgi:pimeloyl-ACP methyl ester carboxylesterase
MPTLKHFLTDKGRTFRFVRRLVLVTGALLVMGYGGIVGYYVYSEPSFVFQPKRSSSVDMRSLSFPGESVSIVSADGLALSGLLMRSTDTTQSGYWIVFLHGNAGNITGASAWYRLFHGLGLNALAIDYRGYGQSEGTPSEAGLYQDTRAAYEYLLKNVGVPEDKIILYGHSLGAALAIHLAAETHPAGLIVEGALISIPARGHELYPFLPVGLIVRNRFDSAKAIGLVSCPKLFLHGQRDGVAPIHHGRYLFEHAQEPKTWVELSGNHGTSVNDPNLQKAVASFLEELRRRQGRKETTARTQFRASPASSQ